MSCLELAVRLCKEAEGFSPTMYKCPAGYPTIGYGRNLNSHPLLDEELDRCTINDNGEVVVTEELATEWLKAELTKLLQRIGTKEWFVGNDERKAVLLDLAYNLGLTKLLTFKNFLTAMAKKDYTTAYVELQSSKWYSQVGLRGIRNCRIIHSGEDVFDYYAKKPRA